MRANLTRRASTVPVSVSVPVPVLALPSRGCFIGDENGDGYGNGHDGPMDPQ